MQTQLELFVKDGDVTIVLDAPHECVKEALENYINTCGLVAFKDFFMKIKFGEHNPMPNGVTRNEYLDIARDVYQSRAAKVERKKSKSKFFAVRNRIKSKRP